MGKIEWHGPFTKRPTRHQKFGLGVAFTKFYDEWRFGIGLGLWMIVFVFEKKYHV